MKINERLLNVCRTRKVPHSELLILTEPIEGTHGEERIKLQNEIADEIERKYPLLEEES